MGVSDDAQGKKKMAQVAIFFYTCQHVNSVAVYVSTHYKCVKKIRDPMSGLSPVDITWLNAIAAGFQKAM